jgi:uncharacterized heparinase superfamily protein
VPNPNEHRPPGAGVVARLVHAAAQGPLILRTLRNLPLRQLLYLVARRAQQKLPARPPSRPLVTPSTWQPALAEAMALAGSREGYCGRADAVLGGELAFVGTTRPVAGIDWQREQVSPLWTYNLHYFDFARDLALAYDETSDDRYLESFQALVLDWIGRCQPAMVGWQPYPTSLRIVNWVYSLLVLGKSLPADARARIDRSLARQAAWLDRRLEYHLSANHLQANYKALIVAGLYFDGGRARRWRRRGFDGTWRAVTTQVLADGVHYERSPMYHAMALADFLEIIALADAVGEPVSAEVRERVARMAVAFGALSRPDGSLHLFNDAANGIAPGRDGLAAAARAVVGAEVATPRGRMALPEAGYWGWVDPEQGVRLVLDCGEPGPRHQPAHAHCDLLSYELDLQGRPVVVDSGTSGYGGDPLREYARSTRAHNTVQVGFREQSEIWSVFRMGRAARVTRAWLERTGLFRFVGAYALHDGTATHERSFDWDGARLRVEDRVDGARGELVRSFIHIHPDLEVRPHDDGLLITGDGVRVALRVDGADRIRVARGSEAGLEGWYCPRFGTAVPAPVVALEVSRYDGRVICYEIAAENA